MRCCGAPRLMEMTRLWEGPQLASRAQSLRLVLRSAQLHFAAQSRPPSLAAPDALRLSLTFRNFIQRN